jgi:hypothetical protein
MTTTRLAAFALGGVLGSLSIPACDLDVSDLNNPGLDELENAPTAVSIGAAATGLLIGNRRNHAAANGYVAQLGIIGREAYNFDSADPRFISELIQGSLNSGSPFGGNFWGGPYANIRLANIVLHAVDKVTELSAGDKAAIRGFAKTIEATDLLEVIVTHDTNGAVIDTDHGITDPLGAIVGDQLVVLREIARLLDVAVTDLGAAGETFPFLFDEGYSGFDSPATFLKLNRAMRARVAVYLQDYAMALTALGASFLDDTSTTIDFDRGVYYTFTTKSGDTTNGLINPNIYAHPSVEADAMNGTNVDARFTRKVGPAKKPGSAKGLSSSLSFSKLYGSPGSPVSMIRNEELVLLKAEALYYTGNHTGALAELNLVRTGSGVLAPRTDLPDDATFVNYLLYERRYSLLFEGHRWIDARRFNKLDTIPLDKPEHTRNVRYPIPLPECNARPGEPQCNLGST